MKETLTTIEKALFLKEIDVYGNVSVEQLADLAAVAEEIHFDPGSEIIREGQPADHGFIIVEGNVIIERDGVITSTINAPQGFGDLSLEAESGYTYTARAADHTHVLRLANDDIVEVMLEHPEIAVGMVRALASRNRELSERLADISRRFQDQTEKGSS
ncbi:MAG: Crp/Fnr family transcriptional regulator [Candidatus Krumholzibacteriia bacterium]